MPEQSWTVTLPGPLYRRQGQWWWEVKLPGDDQARVRLLSVPATCGPEIAEKAARDLWTQAVVRDGTRQVLLDCSQEVERFKAQFLDKLRRLTEIIESASVKTQAEAGARAEMEARLNAMILAVGFGPLESGQEAPSSTSGVPDWPLDLHVDSSAAPAIERPAPSVEFGFCEGCGATSIPTADLRQIDSGQFLCPDCLHTLRVEALQAEWDALAESLA
ncbi:MAG TPA: hypothetical protein PKH24_13935 [Sedimentisphaerales bacterium]|jgi:hypothetical protein|nr:hypothetical protein [Sedimentisphaerales bacterium]HNU28383.1 hypothetical protein [Sedimentisphaerales bacterium]